MINKGSIILINENKKYFHTFMMCINVLNDGKTKKMKTINIGSNQY